MSLRTVFADSSSIEEYAGKYLKYMESLFKKTDLQSIETFLKILLEARKRGKRVFFIGNGGSASTASHFAADFGKNISEHPKENFKAISLVDNVAMTTALANDKGYENVFVGQLAVLMEEGDVVVGISASGNSENVLKAIRYANAHKGITVGLAGFDGGILKKEAQLSIHLPSEKGDYGPVEDFHLALDHILSTFISFSDKKRQNKV